MNQIDQAINQEQIKNPNEEVVTLEEPIRMGEQMINQVTIRKPGVKALSGTSLQAIYQHDVDALCKVLPRVTSPALTPQQIYQMDPVDFATLGGHLVTFFVPESLTEGNQGSDSLELVDDVDEAIANIAVIFHWPPSTYDDMDIVELSKWHRRALIRNQTN